MARPNPISLRAAARPFRGLTRPRYPRRGTTRSARPPASDGRDVRRECRSRRPAPQPRARPCSGHRRDVPPHRPTTAAARCGRPGIPGTCPAGSRLDAQQTRQRGRRHLCPSSWSGCNSLPRTGLEYAQRSNAARPAADRRPTAPRAGDEICLSRSGPTGAKAPPCRRGLRPDTGRSQPGAVGAEVCPASGFAGHTPRRSIGPGPGLCMHARRP